MGGFKQKPAVRDAEVFRVKAPRCRGGLVNAGVEVVVVNGHDRHAWWR